MKPGEFGIFQLISLPGGSRTFAQAKLANQRLELVPHVVEVRGSPYPLFHFSFWVADEGYFYAPALQAQGGVPLETTVFAKAPNSAEAWNLGLEALQSGLFENIVLKTSQTCRPALLRKMQLVAEDLQCRVFVLCKAPLPHWFFKNSFCFSSLKQVTSLFKPLSRKEDTSNDVKPHETISLSSKSKLSAESYRRLLELNAKSKRLRS